MAFDIETALRRTRSARAAGLRLERRADADLVFVEDLPAAGRRLLLDTCVYIDALKGKSPPVLGRMIAARTVHHSALAVAELSFSFGRLDPADPRTPSALAAVRELIEAIPAHRVVVAAAQDWTEGAIRAGAIARALHFGEGERRKAFHDGVLAAQAARTGMVLVTRNLADFDRLAQLDPRLRVAFYRT